MTTIGARLPETRTMFTSSCPLVVLDHLRVPYLVDPGRDRSAVPGLGELHPRGGGARLLWPRDIPDTKPVAGWTAGIDGQAEIPVFARVLSDDVVGGLLSEVGGSWSPVRALRATNGSEVTLVWVRDDGSVFLTFDPDEVLVNYWSERYLDFGHGKRVRRPRNGLMAAYYHARPFLPRGVQIFSRRRFARVQARTRFPRWPVESCAEDFAELILAILTGIAGEPVPYIAPWPHGHTWALVLTHDVEHASGLAAMSAVVDLERAHGMRSAWNLVAGRYHVTPELVAELRADGFEIGVHGLYHDGRDLASLATWTARLPGIRQAAERWGALGFRSPALHRRWEWMPLLGLDYDSSYPDTDPFEPQAGGCCTWLPFFNQSIVELPITLVQDHTLFVILQQRDETIWLDKTRVLRERGGMALIDTHPDYLVDDRIMRAYRNVLSEFATDSTAWRALPREVSTWWRRRGASVVTPDGDDWQIVGPAAAEARIQLRETSRLKE